MRRRRRFELLSLALLSVALSAGCREAAPKVVTPPEPDRQELEKRRAAQHEAFNTHNAEAWASVYDAEADFIYESGTLHQGPAAIQKLFAKIFLDNPGIKLSTKKLNERFFTPELVLEDGEWQMAPRRDGGATAGRYTKVWVHRSGQWFLMSHRSWVPLKVDDPAL